MNIIHDEIWYNSKEININLLCKMKKGDVKLQTPSFKSIKKNSKKAKSQLQFFMIFVVFSRQRFGLDPQNNWLSVGRRPDLQFLSSDKKIYSYP